MTASGRDDERSGGSSGDAPDERDTSSGKAGTAGSPVGDASVDGASGDESGYRRDDYWREESREGGASPTDVPEPSQGYGFETPEERARAEDDDTSTTSSPKGKEQGDAGGRDDARIVDD